MASPVPDTQAASGAVAAEGGSWPVPWRKRAAQLVLLAGLVVALAGIATFHPPTCNGGNADYPASCTSWETAQWLMIGGVLLAVVAVLYLSLLKMEEARAQARAR